jgi:formylglycine-generating enzyme required for sulfatase activity
MAGNVFERCEDYYGPYEKLPTGKNPVQRAKQSLDRHVVRGGSWFTGATFCRSAFRQYSSDDRYHAVGFRLFIVP